MGANTSIGWANFPGLQGATWNPLRAINRRNGQVGYACIKHGPGCLNCYAERINKAAYRVGNGLPYTLEAMEDAKIYLSGDDIQNSGQTSIEWPLRAKASHSIFAVDMSDWMGEFLPVQTTNILLITMMLAQQHIFITLTKREKRLHDLLVSLTRREVGALRISKGDKLWNEAVLWARGNYTKWPPHQYLLPIANPLYMANVPWPPRNVIFGVSIANQAEAITKGFALRKIREALPEIKLLVSYEPALTPVDWEGFGYDGLLDWLIVGGESGDNARRMSLECVTGTIEFGAKHGVPVYVKQMGTVLAGEMGLTDWKGQDVPAEFSVRQFPNIEGAYIPWKRKTVR